MIDGFDAFLWRALLGGIGVTLIAGPLGCFVVWQRMSYFGSTLAHSALLGVILSLWLEVPAVWGMLLVCTLLSWLLLWLFERSRYSQEWSSDVILGVVGHTMLALGLIVLSKLERIRIDLNALLFGDVLAIGEADLWAILAVGIIVYVTLFFIWRRLLLITLSEELAQVEGIAVGRIRLLYLSLLALVVAVAIKVVGMLLLISLLIIPAAVARKFSNTPERMAILACACGMLSVLGGLWLSVCLDWPAGAAIAAVASVFFAFSILKK